MCQKIEGYSAFLMHFEFKGGKVRTGQLGLIFSLVLHENMFSHLFHHIGNIKGYINQEGKTLDIGYGLEDGYKIPYYISWLGLRDFQGFFYFLFCEVSLDDTPILFLLYCGISWFKFWSILVCKYACGDYFCSWETCRSFSLICI